MGRSAVETVLGAAVLLVAGLFLYNAYTSAHLAPVSGYPVKASFFSIDGLSTGADVRIAGVKVGSVVGQSIDTETYQAVVTMSVAAEVRIPEDSLATITSGSLLGEKYVKIEPGRERTFLEEGGIITNTRPVVAVEELLGKAIFLLSEQ